MKPLFLLALACALCPASLFAQKPVKSYEELQQLFSEAGLTSDLRQQGGIRVAIPDTRWELYTYLTGRNSKVWFTFTCQKLPKPAPAAKLLELLEANDDNVTGCYFSFPPKQGNLYINLMLDNRALTAEPLRSKVEQVADFAHRHAKLWDCTQWESSATTEADTKEAPTRETAAKKQIPEKNVPGKDKPTGNDTMEEASSTIQLAGNWMVSAEQGNQTLLGGMKCTAEGKFNLSLLEAKGTEPAVNIEGTWKLEGKTLYLTSQAGKTNEFTLIASVTGSRTEYQFLPKDPKLGKLILSREK
ncbi:MAG TPA: type III secretion system chaperone [Gemmatales bacterium]|nr:type III secretion system chaperone [Gemmatales bacterium]